MINDLKIFWYAHRICQFKLKLKATMHAVYAMWKVKLHISWYCYNIIKLHD